MGRVRVVGIPVWVAVVMSLLSAPSVFGSEGNVSSTVYVTYAGNVFEYSAGSVSDALLAWKRVYGVSDGSEVSFMSDGSFYDAVFLNESYVNISGVTEYDEYYSMKSSLQNSYQYIYIFVMAICVIVFLYGLQLEVDNDG